MGENKSRQCCLEECAEWVSQPIRCNKCQQYTCEDHRTYDAHRCPAAIDRKVPTCPVCSQIVSVAKGADPDAVINRHIEKGCPKEATAATPVKERLNFCSHPKCKKNEHVAIFCKSCKNSYCLDHRQEVDHDCRVWKEGEERKRRQIEKEEAKKRAPTGDRARDALTLAFVNVQSEPFGTKEIPNEEDRVCLGVILPLGSGAAPRWMHFHQNWVAGKLVDKICDHAKIKNDMKSGQRLNLFNMATCEPMPMNKSLKELGVGSASYIMLESGTELPDWAKQQAKEVMRASGGRSTSRFSPSSSGKASQPQGGGGGTKAAKARAWLPKFMGGRKDR